VVSVLIVLRRAASARCHKTLVTACGAILLFGAAAQAAVTMTMDDLAFQPIDGLSHMGVTFGFTVGGVPSGDANYNSAGPGTTTYTQDPSIEGTTAGVIQIDFAVSTNVLDIGFGLSTNQTESGSVIVELFDPSLTSLGTFSVDTEPGSFPFASGLFENMSALCVGRAVVSFNSPTAGRFVMDNMTYEESVACTASNCGNTVVDAGEQCDDGNTSDGDCCDSTCQYEASGSPCPSDGDPCTANTCDGSGSCGQVPTGCKSAAKSLLLLKNNTSDDSKDKLTWKWLKGADTTLGELGSPTSTTDYTLCLYAGTSTAAVAIPAGSNWQPMGTAGFKYKDASGTGAPGGAQKALLKSGAAGKSKVLVKGKGTALPDTLVPALPLPVIAKLINDESSVCYEAVYNAPQVIKNDAKQFKAKQ